MGRYFCAASVWGFSEATNAASRLGGSNGAARRARKALSQKADFYLPILLKSTREAKNHEIRLLPSICQSSGNLGKGLKEMPAPPPNP